MKLIFDVSVIRNENRQTELICNKTIKQKQWKDKIQFVKQEEALAVQMGTTYIKKDFFGDKLMEPTPLVKEDGTVTNQQGIPFSIVHQYDRDPRLKQIIHNKYKR